MNRAEKPAETAGNRRTPAETSGNPGKKTLIIGNTIPFDNAARVIAARRITDAHYVLHDSA